MVHLWIQESSANFLSLSELYPPKILTFYLIGLAALLLFYFWVRGAKNHHLDVISPMATFIIATIVQAGFYIFYLGFIDEVFVNLDHPWNLLNHGRFSFQPDHLVDGTVEFLYYFLLTPWATSRPLLIQALMVQGWVVAWLHLVVLFAMLRHEKTPVRIWSLLILACHPTVNDVFAGGFGNSLISLVFLSSLAFWWNSKLKTAAFFAVIMPLIRLDAIVYVPPLVVLIFMAKPRFRTSVITSLSALSSVILVLCIHRTGYGYWVPTPILFKSMPIHVLAGSIHRFPNALIALFISPMNLVLFGSILAGSHLLIRNPKTRHVLSIIPYLIFISIFYYIQARINPPDRYYLPMNIVIVILSGYAIGSIQSQTSVDSNDNQNPAISLFLSRYGLLIFMIGLLQFAVNARRVSQVGLDTHFNNSAFSGPVIRNDQIVHDAMILHEIIPENSGWRTATTELDTFGFFLDRPILPLWGYANREIALSKTFNSMDIRCDPKILERTRPELFWVWHRTMDPRLRVYDASEDRNFFTFMSSAGLGSSEYITNQYHLLLINRGGTSTQILVRHDIWPIFQNRLTHAGYREIQSRPWNIPTVEK